MWRQRAWSRRQLSVAFLRALGIDVAVLKAGDHSQVEEGFSSGRSVAGGLRECLFGAVSLFIVP
jgi:hypothetical protein